MTSTDQLAELAHLAELANTAELELTRALAARDDQVRAALAAGIGPTAIAQALGVQRARVYQIKANS